MPSVRMGKTAVRGPTAQSRPSFVLGSRPPSLRAQPPGSLTIKPQPGSTTQYGKQAGQPNFGKQPTPPPFGFGNTALTGES
jgi:hypothetical protein